jgi:hypothetical protein
MKTIHIERLDLRCRGIPQASAHAAVRELGPALLRHLSERDGAAGNSAARGGSATIRVSGDATPAALADAMAARVAAAIRTRAATRNKPKKS